MNIVFILYQQGKCEHNLAKIFKLYKSSLTYWTLFLSFFNLWSVSSRFRSNDKGVARYSFYCSNAVRTTTSVQKLTVLSSRDGAMRVLSNNKSGGRGTLYCSSRSENLRYSPYCSNAVRTIRSSCYCSSGSENYYVRFDTNV